MTENLVQITKRYTSRSAVLSAKTCMYKRYLQYHYNNYGLSPSQQSLDLLIGTIVHRGIQHLLEHCRLHRPDEQLTNDCIDEAVETAREVWLEALSQGSLYLHSGEDERLGWILSEQEVLFEGLIRAWAIRRLPVILEDYIILEVEKEEVFEDFTIENCSICFGSGMAIAKELHSLKTICINCNGTGKIHPVIFLGKADGLFLRKSDNKIIQLSIKTASMFPEVTARNIQHDMQGVSEQVCTNDRLMRMWKEIREFCKTSQSAEIALTFKQAFIGEWETNKELFEFLAQATDKCPEVYAVQYEFLIKGQRKQDPYNSGIYKQQSFLCHPYKQDSIMNLMGSSIGFTPTNYQWKPKTGRLPKGWDKIDIWEDIGIQNWVEMLAMGKIQPEEGDPLQNILITPGLIIRLPEEIEEWKVSTAFGEEEIAKHLDEIEQIINRSCEPTEADRKQEQLNNKIWQYFPKNTMSCHSYYGRDCQYVNHCHELSSLEMLEDSGLMQKRFPHHKLELQLFEEKGYINE